MIFRYPKSGEGQLSNDALKLTARGRGHVIGILGMMVACLWGLYKTRMVVSNDEAVVRAPVAALAAWAELKASLAP